MAVKKIISVQKGSETALMGVVSVFVSLGSVYVAKKFGIQIDDSNQAIIVTTCATLLTGVFQGIHNFITHKSI